MTQHAATTIAAGLARKPVLIDGQQLGTAATWVGVRAILRSSGFAWLERELEDHASESRHAFHVTRARVASPAGAPA